MRSITKLRIKIGAVFFASALMFLVVIGAFSAMIIKGCSDINERGLKNIVEQVWEGNQQGQGETK